MLDCLKSISCKSYLESLDWIPVVSTASNLFHIFAKYACRISPHSSYGQYIYSRSIHENLSLLIPFYNVVIQTRHLSPYRSIPQGEIEMTSVGVIQERRDPKLGLDEVLITLEPKETRYHTAPIARVFISDKDIHSKLPYLYETEQGVRYSTHHKAVIQQNSMLSATAACVDMLCLDEGKTTTIGIKEEYLTTKSLVKKFQSRGLAVKVSRIPSSIAKQPELFMETLKHYLFLRGSFMIGLDSDQIGPHTIIIDDVSDCLCYIRLRDPYHGWEITVKRKALLKKLQHQILQVDRSGN